MAAQSREARLRILVVDDDSNIHNDYERCFERMAPVAPELRSLEAELFGVVEDEEPEDVEVELVHAYQGQDAVELVREGLAQGKQFPVAFIDMRMPPGWNGVQTLQHLWQMDDSIHVVICTAYSDVSLDALPSPEGRSMRPHILRKPFTPAQVRQLATELAESWCIQRRV